MQLERRILVACSASLSALVLALALAEPGAGKTEFLSSGCCAVDSAPLTAAALSVARGVRRDASSTPSSSTLVSEDDSAPSEDQDDERPETIAMGGGLHLVVVHCGLTATQEVDCSEARISGPTDDGNSAEPGAVESERMAEHERPSAVALGPSSGPNDAPLRRPARPAPPREAGSRPAALVPPGPGEASAAWLVALGSDTLGGLASVTVLGLSEPIDTGPDPSGSRPPVVLATQAASPLAIGDWTRAAHGPALELLVGAPGYAWQRVRVAVEEQEHVVVLRRCGDVDVAGRLLRPAGAAADLEQVGVW